MSTMRKLEAGRIAAGKRRIAEQIAISKKAAEQITALQNIQKNRLKAEMAAKIGKNFAQGGKNP